MQKIIKLVGQGITAKEIYEDIENGIYLCQDRISKIIVECKEYGLINPEEEKKAKEAILEAYPPKRLVDADNWLMEAAGKTKDSNIKAQLEQAHQTVLATMVKKTEDYAKGDIIVDQSNIADVYDGANLMFDHIEKQTDDTNVKNNIATSKEKLEAEIKIYDETNGFTGLTANNEQEIRKTYEAVLTQADKQQFPPEEFKEFFSHLQLTSKDPAKGMADAKEREELLQLFHDSVRQQAARQVAVKNKGAKKEDLSAALTAEIKEAYAVQVGALLIIMKCPAWRHSRFYTGEC